MFTLSEAPSTTSYLDINILLTEAGVMHEAGYVYSYGMGIYAIMLHI